MCHYPRYGGRRASNFHFTLRIKIYFHRMNIKKNQKTFSLHRKTFFALFSHFNPNFFLLLPTIIERSLQLTSHESGVCKYQCEKIEKREKSIVKETFFSFSLNSNRINIDTLVFGFFFEVNVDLQHTTYDEISVRCKSKHDFFFSHLIVGKIF